MSFFWRLAVVALIAAGIALAVLARRPAAGASVEAPRSVRLVTVWLGVVLASLALVGVVSHTVLRHVIQVTPLGVALLLLVARSKVGVPAAAPLFAFWLLLMIAIWLFLTGIARIAQRDVHHTRNRAHHRDCRGCRRRIGRSPPPRDRPHDAGAGGGGRVVRRLSVPAHDCQRHASRRRVTRRRHESSVHSTSGAVL